MSTQLTTKKKKKKKAFSPEAFCKDNPVRWFIWSDHGKGMLSERHFWSLIVPRQFMKKINLHQFQISEKQVLKVFIKLFFPVEK